MNNLNSEKIRDLLRPYGPPVTEGTCALISSYISMLLRWNEKVSLTAVTEPEEIVRFHFGESIFAVSACGIEKGRLADIGSGAGFPGIPIGMVSAELSLTLIEANTKKAGFLAEVVRKIALANARVIRSRMEEINGSDAYDFITARAVGNHEGVLQWSRSHLAPGGQIVFWLGARDCANVARAPGWDWDSPVRIPNTESRFLLAGKLVSRGTSDSCPLAPEFPV